MRPISELLREEMEIDQWQPPVDVLLTEIEEREQLIHQVLHKGPWQALYSADEWKEASRIRNEVESLRAELFRLTVLNPYAERAAKANSEIRGNLGSIVGNRDNRASKRDALDYYREHEHEFRSKRAAAQYIADNIIPYKWRTIYGWLRE